MSLPQKDYSALGKKISNGFMLVFVISTVALIAHLANIGFFN